MRLAEDLTDSTLSPIEEARGYRRLAEEFGITQAEIGRLVGKSQSTIANKLRLLRLPESIQARVEAEGVSERHARALLDLKDESLQNEVLDQVRERGLSVREIEQLIRKLLATREETAGALDSEGERAGPRSRKRRAPGAQAPEGLFGGAGVSRARSPGSLGQVSDRRAIRAFRDIRLFLNTFRRASTPSGGPWRCSKSRASRPR